MKTTSGSKIHLSITKPSGEILDYGEYTNYPNALWLVTAAGRGSTTTFNFVATDTSFIKPLAGTWSQSGFTISRVTGVDVLNTQSGYYIFADGTHAGWKDVDAGGSSGTVSKSETVAAQKLYEYNINNVAIDADRRITSVGGQQNYTNGVTTLSTVSAINFPAALSAYDLRIIYQCLSIGTASGVKLVIDPPINVGIGDVVTINKYQYTFSYPTYQKVPFTTSPITGLVGTGFMQRLKKVNVIDNQSSPTRIYLASDANKITIPDMLGPSSTVLNPASYTFDETIVGSGTRTGAAMANDMTECHNATGLTVTGGTIKQILWGNAAELFGVVEYDTPVTIAAGKTISIGLSTQYNPSFTVPTSF